MKAANPRGGFTFLRDVVALSKTEAWAVGEHDSADFEVSRTLIERWDGHRWSLTPSPNVGSQDALYGIAAISGTDAWAVGTTTVVDDPVIIDQSRTLIEHWDGERWSVVPGATIQARQSGLFSVIAVSANDVWAVGGDSGGEREWEPLIEHWDGRSWSVVPSAIKGGILTGLAQFPLAHPPGVDLFTVGSHDAQFRDVMQHWDGLKWTVAPGAPITGHLHDVGGTSGNDLWAVGEFGDGVGARPLVAHWNGVKWAVSRIPFRHFKPRYDKQASSELNGVFAVSPKNVWAVGFGIEHWNGSRWALVALQKWNAGVFWAIDGSSAKDLWAVGTTIKHYSCK